NPAPGSDMAASVRAGLAALGPDSAYVFVALCDHPLVTARTLAAMGARQGEGEIVIPVCSGRKGHPTLFPRVILADIGRLATLREVIACHRERVRFLDVTDEGVVLDMDTPEDYERLVALAGGGCAGPR
ncbi:MAG TPA: NTP transferase domain-containing protein, partial [Geobacteraceae bacterium]